MLVSELKKAILELSRAETLFNMADQEHFEIANLQLQLAQERYNLLIKKIHEFEYWAVAKR